MMTTLPVHIAVPGGGRAVRYLLVAWAWLLLGLPTSAASAAEELHYRVSYRGIFSVGAEVSIADVVLRTRTPAAQSPYAESELVASSEAYAHVESIYPIRYRFRSWCWRDRSAVLASEYFEYGDPRDTEHKLIYLDRPGKPFVSRPVSREAPLDIPVLRSGAYEPVAAKGERRAFDRLGLLQRIRGSDLHPGAVVESVVSNGSRMLRYRAKVEKAMPLRVAGREWSALKLRFDGLETDAHGNQKHSHRPVYIWVSADPSHIPLLAESRHALGRFRVELVPSRPSATELALRAE